ADAARDRRRGHFGLHCRHRVLHHTGLSRWKRRKDDWQHDCVSHAEIPQLGSWGGDGECAAGRYPDSLLDLRQIGRDRQLKNGL
ncbi:uncharacterized protein METZ01_LOCUS312257, partial [marine metagenome]